MTVSEIVMDYLKKNGFDGLASDNCGCGVETGLVPCGCDCSKCQPAYKRICPGDEICELGQSCCCGTDGDTCYSTEKQK